MYNSSKKDSQARWTSDPAAVRAPHNALEQSVAVTCLSQIEPAELGAAFFLFHFYIVDDDGDEIKTISLAM